MIEKERVSTEVEMGERERSRLEKESGSDGTGEVVGMGRAGNQSAEQGRKQCDHVTYREEIL